MPSKLTLALITTISTMLFVSAYADNKTCPSNPQDQDKFCLQISNTKIPTEEYKLTLTEPNGKLAPKIIDIHYKTGSPTYATTSIKGLSTYTTNKKPLWLTFTLTIAGINAISGHINIANHTCNPLQLGTLIITPVQGNNCLRFDSTNNAILLKQ